MAEKFRLAGVVCICLASFFTPLSTSLLGTFSILSVVAWLLSGGIAELPQVFRSNPSTLVALLLFALMTAAISYAAVPAVDGLQTLRKYRELILLPVLFCLLQRSKKHRRMTENALLAGCIVLLAVSYLLYFEVLKDQRYGFSVVYHITHSFFMAVLSYLSLQRSTVAGTYRGFWVIVCIAAIVNLFYIAPGRTGMFIFCCLILLFLFQRLNPARLALSLVVFAVLLGIAYQTSDNFSSRVNEAYGEIITYQPGQSKTSVGQRFDWWHISMRLIREKPILGHGTGSYAGAHQRMSRGTEITPTDNPHNEYLFLSVQFGVVGLSLFLLMIVLQLWEAKKAEKRDRQLLQGVILALLAGSLMNSLLFDSQQGHFYLFMSGALLAGSDHPEH